MIAFGFDCYYRRRPLIQAAVAFCYNIYGFSMLTLDRVFNIAEHC